MEELFKAYLRYMLTKEAFEMAHAKNASLSNAVRQLTPPLQPGDVKQLDESAMTGRMAQADFEHARRELASLVELTGLTSL
jgi:hypothetical protein